MFSLNMLPVCFVVWYVFLDYHFQGNIPFVTFKGQLISKCPFDVFKSPKKPMEFYLRISALDSKKRSNPESSVRESK